MKRKMSPEGRAAIATARRERAERERMTKVAANGDGHAEPPQTSDKATWQLVLGCVDAGLMTEREALHRLAARAGYAWNG
jgi:hypothetical protein